MTTFGTFLRRGTIAIAAASVLLAAGAAQAAVMLTDSTVFSSNETGENWNGMIWDTQSPPADFRNIWNMYYSSSSDPLNPVFLNGGGTDPGISIDMTPGTHSFVIFGEGFTAPVDPRQHFVLNLYFQGNQGAPDISGLYGPTCPTVCAASSWNGLDLFGTSGLGGNANAQEAGTLMVLAGGLEITLEHFTWAIDTRVDQVWEQYAGDYFGQYSGRPDFVGEVRIRVRSTVPEPQTLALLGLGLLGAGLIAMRRRSA
ncbi:PEP-CTERM sorting domain-containing protein [Futiania mangrovi]|uniref:PEP-CTERM sorting domain-containing protein n=1 Tax=Futiania mangrovi TaxID=2959716 RepID=A0A9J6PBK3_9PROT|nr:PEP-CTERM sorting domain-containing protein [Futiania mangrovii]MCP1337524.1 PEP-CTERM sorting domain-containing protein [Futiania mangrovii]